MGLTGPSKTIKTEPVPQKAPTIPEREAPPREAPAAPEREKVPAGA